MSDNIHGVSVETREELSTGIQFRIVSQNPPRMSRWYSYQSVARMKVIDTTYYAVTDYYAGIFPVLVPFVIEEIGVNDD